MKLLLKSQVMSPGIVQIQAELVQGGGNALLSEICELFHSIWNKEELPQQWKEFIIVPTYKEVIKLTVVIVEGYQCYQLHTKFHPLFLTHG
jgi:hypothetical protein